MATHIRNKFTVLATTSLLTLKSGMTSLTPSTVKQTSITPAVAAVQAHY